MAELVNKLTRMTIHMVLSVDARDRLEKTKTKAMGRGPINASRGPHEFPVNGLECILILPFDLIKSSRRNKFINNT